jgi:RNA polymerase sigma factor (sigma-70 family)
MTPLLAQRSRPDRSFERLYRRHVADVYHYALAVMRNQADAEDVTQTTFLNAFRAFERGERPKKPQNWLIAIAHNVCRQRFRQSARRPTEVSFDEDIGDRFVGVPEEEEGPGAEDIRRALGHLAFNQRAALVMRELEGRSYAEIAEILELSASAVETLIFRARRALREQLESSLTCGEAELAISRQLDGRLSRGEKGALRAHLRECPECATFARRQRAQRTALKSLAAVPVPASLTSLFGGGGGAAVGTGLALKAGAAIATGIAIGGAGYVGVTHTVVNHHPTQRSQTPVQSVSRSSPTHAVVARHRPGSGSPSVRPKAAAVHMRKAHPAHGDASIGARHARLAATKPAHPQHPVHAVSRYHAPVSHARPKLPPGPYIGGPPRHGAASESHGKRK